MDALVQTSRIGVIAAAAILLLIGIAIGWLLRRPPRPPGDKEAASLGCPIHEPTTEGRPANEAQNTHRGRAGACARGSRAHVQPQRRGGRVPVHVENVVRQALDPVLVVADSGAGISAQVVKRIFEPFFTTKAVNVGNRLGLALVQGIVLDVGGAIDVASTPGSARWLLQSLRVNGYVTKAPWHTASALATDDAAMRSIRGNTNARRAPVQKSIRRRR